MIVLQTSHVFSGGERWVARECLIYFKVFGPPGFVLVWDYIRSGRSRMMEDDEG